MQKGQISIFLLVGILIIAVAGGAYFLGKSTSPKPTATPTVISQTPQPTATPSSTPDETAKWKTYIGETAYTNDGSSTFQIKYPSEWQIEDNMLYPIGKNPDKGLETVIILGAGGHGGPKAQGEKIYPAGKANYFLDKSYGKMNGYTTFSIGNYSYIFEIKNLPIQFEDIFEKILQTLTILNKK